MLLSDVYQRNVVAIAVDEAHNLYQVLVRFQIEVTISLKDVKFGVPYGGVQG